ncbi:hypothetical protein ABMA27_012486 [Loxostege sticticalis]|uniref:TIR domain-containing protein n=1 Tax=Loxostege sticticalis TaxID=481309 RepID=A0ABR3H1G9_LOXSC
MKKQFKTNHAVTMLLILFFAATASASCLSHPHCACARMEGMEMYTCSTEGVKFKMASAVNEEAHIQCSEGRLTCENFPSLRISYNGYLPTLKLDSCRLPDSLACVMEKLGVEVVNTVRVENCSALRGEHITGLGVKELWIENTDHQKTLPLDAIAGTPITDFRVHDSPFEFTPFTTQNTHLWRLEIFNSIKEIPSGSFRSFRNLTFLALYGNQIESLSEGAFEGLDNLNYLDLSRNPLSELRARTFAAAPRLRDIILHRTGLETVRTDAFEGLSLLKMIEFKEGENEMKFENLSLANLPRLKRALIENSSLSPLPEDLFKGSVAIATLVIAFCGLEALPENVFKDQINLKELKLNGNKLKVLPEELFRQLGSLEDLDLSGNLLEVLPGTIFEGLNNLKAIHMDSNRLTTIPQATFSGLTNLIQLTLRDNLLTFLENDKVEDENVSPFSELRKLEEIDLSGNHISVIFDDRRLSWIHRIRKIDLSRNRIRSLRTKDIEFLGFNVTVDLRYNNITSIGPVGPNLYDKKEHIAYMGATFILDHNPIACNCTLHSFLYFTRNRQYPKFNIDDSLCASPYSLIDRKIQDLPLEDLICDLKVCPAGCSCIVRPETSTIELDCIETPIEFPDPKSLNLTKSKLRVRTLESLLNIPEHVEFLDLHNLSLTELPLIPDTVLELNLTFNHLTVIPKEIFRQNLSVYLVGNKIKCDCWNKEQIEMLDRNKDSIKDYNSIRCDDESYLRKIVVTHICDLWWAVLIGGTLVALGVMAAVTAGIVYYHIREIQKYIYKQGWPLPPGVFEEEIDNKSFDVLISYSDTYEKFTVSRLVPLLRRAGYTVCLRCIEWDVGDFLPHKVPELVEKSRRTVVLLSSDYFESEARLELRAALMNERRDRRKRLLLVITKDFSPDPSLERFLEARENFFLNDTSFWETLKTRLPKKRKEKKVKPSQKTLNVLMTTEQQMLFNSKMSLNQL